MKIESSRESGRKLISGIADYAREHGPWQFIWEPQGIKRLAGRSYDTQRYDGILVRDISLMNARSNRSIPTVVFSYAGKSKQGAFVCTTNDQMISQTAVEEFLKRGFKNFAFCGFKDSPWSLRRERHFVDRLNQEKRRARKYKIESSLFGLANEDRKVEAVVDWLLQLPKPVALMAANDDVARWILQLCRGASIRVPEACAVIGVDNDPVICGMSTPPLSSISIEQYRSGYDAAELLHKLMRGENVSKRLIEAPVEKLVVRQSSDVFAIDDLSISKALRFMHQHARQNLKMDAIARESGLHRRALERRFKARLRQTLRERFHEIRGDAIAQVLVDSHDTLETIAEQFGFSHASALTRFFLKIKGQTPSRFRKRQYPV